MTFSNQLQTDMGDLFLETFHQTRDFLVAFLPRFALALLIVGLGWLAALFSRKIVVKVTRGLGIDVVAEKFGLTRFLHARGIDLPLSRILGLVAYWIVLLGALSLALQHLQLEDARELITQAAALVPRLIAALLMLGLGLFLSGPAGHLADRLARLAHLPFHWAVGQLARAIVLALALFKVLEYLGLASPTILGIAAAVLLTALVLGFGVFVFFGRDLASSMLAQRFLLQELEPGDLIETDRFRGEVVRIGATTTHLRDGTGILIVPNVWLTRTSIRRRASAAPAAQAPGDRPA